jgi:hypothetical protein
MKNVCVFLGSRLGNQPHFVKATEELAEVLVKNSLRLIYGGGRVGLMGTLADAVLNKGGEVVGVIPKDLFSKEVGHDGLTKLYEVSSMHERKALMENLSHAFIAMPGGFGTLDEMCEIITWSQIGLHDKPMALLNTGGFFDGFMKFIGDAASAGFIPEGDVSKLIFSKDPAEVVAKIKARLKD